MEPSLCVLRMMLRNWSGVCSWLWAVMVALNCTPSDDGRLPS